ncbi:multisubunit sodium/proton antiporter MrpF subunit [Antricoccus suffuscus]|uniref:Multisubunit sodium/proton antiporter MrpF subunit n=1 Tax=Antricoccus suffuscus TaxID=1629062 RepID=A0A2T1A3F0_9ACTN|nr:monovalent cation/H+ antiporter complex subunit F [Antricoccus suffuscus]PRZ43017.1 multisubunit sodium/proton antiporter MrpF subunit [Antricoccus suffuscus]
MKIILIITISMLVVAAILTLFRLTRGPRSLDRAVAADVLVAIVIAGLGLEAAFNRHPTTLPILVVLCVVGFASSVSIARFLGPRESDREDR